MVTGALGNFCLRACAGQSLERPLVSPDRRTAGITNRSGRPHHINEDGFLAMRSGDKVLLAVCDGVGGLPHGDIASTMAIKSLEFQFHSLKFALKPAVIEANRVVYKKSMNPSLPPTSPLIEGYFERENGTIGKMFFPAPPDQPDITVDYEVEIGTTLITSLINARRARVACSGDSKAFLFDRRQRMYLMNEDHNQSTQSYLTTGSLRFPLYYPRHLQPNNYYEWERKYFKTNAIYASLGSHPEYFLFALTSRRIRHGDRMLLTSDGLTNVLPYQVVVQILLKFSPVEETVCELFETAERFMQYSGNRGDNITILLHEHFVEQ